MKELALKFELKPVWISEQANLSTCEGCGDLIYNNMIRCWISSKSKGETKMFKTELVFCESCYELINK